jgi:hypothetical protein
MKLGSILIFSALNALLVASGCSSDSAPASDTSAPGGPVTGALDDHCEGQPVGVADPAACSTPMSPDDEGAGGAGDETAAGGTGGAEDCNAAHDTGYGATLYNADGDDDDCKYRVSWTSTPIRLNQDVTFTVSAHSKADNSPLEGLTTGENALSQVELYIPCVPGHFPPFSNSNAKISETAPGVYSAGPIRFDMPGRWVVRFHFYESCLDQETSPHGHIAFFVDVP